MSPGFYNQEAPANDQDAFRQWDAKHENAREQVKRGYGDAIERSKDIIDQR